MTQSTALEVLKLGKNVFLTGAPGAGKTYLLNQYIAWLNANNVHVAVTAYTGIAASHLNGRTLHSWAGLPRGLMASEGEERTRIRNNKHLMARIQNTKVLIIDEISMLHPEEFDRVNFICQTARGSHEPFGGLQLICCGDFFQIPPVKQVNDQFVLDCAAWKNADMQVCYLHEQHRQGDKALLQILSEIREGRVSANTIKLLESRRDIKVASTVGVAQLYTHRDDVQDINMAELRKLKGDIIYYDVLAKGEPKSVEIMKREYEVDRLGLTIGAHVMFTRNNPGAGYVNGTLGQVVEFVNMDMEAAPVVQTFDGRKIVATREEWDLVENGKTVSIKQFPLKLAWAITIHKSQGMTLDAAIIDLGRAFAPGMGYVALSRVRALQNISLINFNKMSLQVSERIKLLDKEFSASSTKSEEYLNSLTAAERKQMEDEFMSRKTVGVPDPNALRMDYGDGVDEVPVHEF